MVRSSTLLEKGMKSILNQFETGKMSLTDTMRLLNQENTAKDTETPISRSVQELFQELDQLIGLTEVKKLVREIFAYLEVQKLRKQQGLISDSIVLHMVFKGNPGTGKTTVARVLGRLFKEMQILSKGHMIEVERADLVGEYIGHTAQKTREQVKKALGGILFIDEAYSLNRGGEKDFGKEAIDTLVKAMEDYKNEFVLILAGYNDEVENFLMSNPGLPSRFPLKVTFPDYTNRELLDIAELMLEMRQYKFDITAKNKLQLYLARNHTKRSQNFSNARFIRNMIERAIRKHAIRLMREQKYSNNCLTRNSLMLITEADVEFDGGEIIDRDRPYW